RCMDRASLDIVLLLITGRLITRSCRQRTNPIAMDRAQLEGACQQARTAVCLAGRGLIGAVGYARLRRWLARWFSGTKSLPNARVHWQRSPLAPRARSQCSERPL